MKSGFCRLSPPRVLVVFGVLRFGACLSRPCLPSLRPASSDLADTPAFGRHLHSAPQKQPAPCVLGTLVRSRFSFSFFKEGEIESKKGGLVGYRLPRPRGRWSSPFRCLHVASVSAKSSSCVLRFGRHSRSRQTPSLRAPANSRPLRPRFPRPLPPFLLSILPLNKNTPG